MPLLERLRFRLDRYLYDGYLDYIEVDSRLYQLIKEAKESLKKGCQRLRKRLNKQYLPSNQRGFLNPSFLRFFTEQK